MEWIGIGSSTSGMLRYSAQRPTTLHESTCDYVFPNRCSIQVRRLNTDRVSILTASLTPLLTPHSTTEAEHLNKDTEHHHHSKDMASTHSSNSTEGIHSSKEEDITRRSNLSRHTEDNSRDTIHNHRLNR